MSANLKTVAQPEKTILKPLTRGVMIGYGTAGIAPTITFYLTIIYLMYFFTDIVGFTPAFAGTIYAIGTIWDAITDPLIGTWSDNLDPKKGRRRPIMIWTAIPFGLVTWLMFTKFNFSMTGQKIYFTLLMIAFFTLQTLLDISYTSLGAEMTEDYKERSVLASVRQFFANVSNIVSAIAIMAVAVIARLYDSYEYGWSVMAGICGVVATVSIIIGWRSTKGYEKTELPNHEKIRVRDIIDGPLKNKPFLFITAISTLAIIAQAGSTSVYFYYWKLAIGLSEEMIGTTTLAEFLPVFMFIPLVNKISVRISKSAAWIFTMSAWLIGSVVFPLFIWTPDSSLFIIYFGCAFYGMGYGALYQLMWSMIPDCIEVDEYKSGSRREGIFYGVSTFVQKASSAIAIFIVGLLLTSIGYESGNTASAETIGKIKYLYSFVSAIPLTISILIAFLNPMNKKRHEAIKSAIELKRQGLKHDTSEFEALL